MTKKLLAILCTATMFLSLFTLPANAARIGDTVGYAHTTDIVATINGYDIPSYNVDGYTYIVVEDLRHYGFAVNYDNSSRTLSVTRDFSQAWVSKSYQKPQISPWTVGQRAHALLYTDIKTYLDGYYTHSYNIDGQTIIRFDALQAYGGVSYDNAKREISLGLAGLNQNPNPTDRSALSVLDSMTAAERREVNIFLSNFSEAYYNPNSTYYTNSDEQMIMFAYLHSTINLSGKKVIERNYYGISASEVDTILYRFFGRTVPHKTPAGSKVWTYRNGYFLIPAADGESYGNFSIATGMYPNGDGTYSVEFNIYYDPSVTGGDVITNKGLYSLSPQQATATCEYDGYGTAIIKPKYYNGSNTYELVSYKVSHTY